MFIVFEGIDGAGKSSHIPRAAQILKDAGVDVVVTREPGGTALGERIRSMVLSEPMDPETELMLMFAARKEHVNQVIQPALNRGATVLCDRYIGSSFAFQGGGRGIPYERIEGLFKWSGIPKPDITLLFDLPTDVARGRIQSRDLDKFELEKEEFSKKVRRSYLEMVDESFIIIDARKPYEEVSAKVDDFFSKMAKKFRKQKVNLK